jgi:hypothetical protein
MGHHSLGRLAVAILVLAGACAGPNAPVVSPPPPAGKPDAEPGFVFDWAPPCRVRVRERATRNGGEAAVEYVLAVARTTGGLYEVRAEERRVVSLDAKGQSALFIATPLPLFYLTADGAFDHAGSLDGMAQEIVAISVGGRDIDPAVSAEALANLRSPALQAQLESKSSERWSAWVGHWVGFDLAAGGMREIVAEVTLADGKTVSVPMREEHHGAVAGRPGFVEVSLQEKIEGELFLTVLRTTIQAIYGISASDLEGGFRENLMSVVLDPLTLRPYEAHQTVKARLDWADGFVHHIEETRDTTFHWETADGCGH